jgi:hypothetical protein
MAEINSYFANNGAVSNYEAASKRIEFLVDKGANRDALTSMVSGFTEEELTLFLNVDVNKYTTE